MLQRLVGVFTASALLLASAPILPAHAATMTQIKWLASTLTASTTADYTVQFTVPTGVDASTDTITLTFDTGIDLGTFALTDYDFEVGDGATCSSATFTDKTLAAEPGAGAWGVATTGTPKNVVTLTAPTDAAGGEVTAGRCVQLKIGSNATLGGAGATVATNGSADTNYDLDITSELGATDDSGSGSIYFITDDSVNVTATVDPYVTFAISDTAIGFGALTTANARFATANASGSDTDSSAAHTLTFSTNAASGYAITYNGATLTSGGNTIDVASVTNDENGTAGTEEFGMGFSTDGDATIATGYDHNATAGNRDWAFVASTTTTIASETGPTATETISAFYLANIAVTTQPGSYATNITYIASGAF